MSARTAQSESARARILFACSSLAVGGVERQWSLLIPRLASGFSTSLITLVDEGPFFEQLRAEGISADCMRMRRRTDVAAWRRALGHARFRPDLVVTQSINADVVGEAIAWRAGARHISTEHAGPGTPSRRHQNLLRRFLAPRLAATVAVSHAQIPQLVRLGYRRERIRVIPNGVPVPTPVRSPETVRESLGVPTDAFLAVLVATLRPEKRADLFVAAVKNAHAADPRIRGIVVGGGPQLGGVVEASGDGGVVRVLGHRADAADMLMAADVACLSSDAEALPMVLLEAMALGKPVVATNVGGVPETVEPDSTGLLVPARDCDAFSAALVKLASDPALARRMGERGRERQQKQFGVDRMVDDYARLFDALLTR
jgi:glycosyltransferase involved in cell wall biosynthesis